MNEILTYNEIVQRYPSEGVLLDQVRIDGVAGMLEGRLLCHSSNREEVYARLKELKWKSKDLPASSSLVCRWTPGRRTPSFHYRFSWLPGTIRFNKDNSFR